MPVFHTTTYAPSVPKDVPVIERDLGNNQTLYSWSTHAGLVLGSGSQYDGDGDSSYYAEVWDGDKTKRVYYGSTRDSGYTPGPIVDATPEVLAGYQAFLAAKAEAARKYKVHCAIQAHRANVACLTQAAGGCSFTRRKLRTLRKTMYSSPDFWNIVKLLNSKPRNTFKQTMKENVVKWLADPRPKFPRPLSPRQLECIVPFERPRYWR